MCRGGHRARWSAVTDARRALAGRWRTRNNRRPTSKAQPIAGRGDVHVREASLRQLRREGRLSGSLAMHQDHLAKGAPVTNGLREGDQITLVGVRAEAIEDLHLRAAVLHDAEDAYLG